MIRLIPLFLWMTIALTSVGCSGASKIDLGVMLTSGRDGWQHPERVVESLGIRPGDSVAEIGAGSGYWLAWLSEAVGPDGRVYAVEVDPELVKALEERIAEEEYVNVEVILGVYDDPRLPEGQIDLAMTCLTYHHIEERTEYFRALRSDLSARGRVAHLDDRPDSPAPISWFQSSGHWSDPAAIVSEMYAAGYAQSASFDFLPAQSFQVFAQRTSTANLTSTRPTDGESVDF
jgi:ubiquinone/menaquinone biosynthesis C-methylase UbiE